MNDLLRNHLTLISICAVLGVGAQNSEIIRRNQVGCYPGQEEVIVVEATPPTKLRVTSPDGSKLKPKSVRTAVSPLSGKVRYVVDLGKLKSVGRYQVSLGNQTCELKVAEREMKPPYPSDIPDESYIDATESYASNEIAINWNASLVAFLCWLDALKDEALE